MRWNALSLDKFCSIAKGRKHPETDGSSKAYRYLQIDDLHTGVNIKYTNEKGTEALATDVLIAWDGANAGKVGAGLHGMLGSTLARIRPNQDVVRTRYLYRFLESRFGTIKAQRTGATIPHINGTHLRELSVPLPPLHIQQQIADTLDKADALRQKDQQLLQKYDELALSLFHNSFDNSVNYISLGNASTKITDGVHFKPVYTESGIPFISVKNITKRYLDFSDCKYVSNKDHERMIKRCKPELNDILYTKVGATYGRAATVDTDTEFSLFVSVCLIKPDKSKVRSNFLKFVLNSDSVKQQADKSIKGAGVPDLHLVEIKKFRIPLPLLAEQDRFCNQLNTIEEMKKKLVQKPADLIFTNLLHTLI